MSAPTIRPDADADASEYEMHVMLLGREAIPASEQMLLLWLLAQPNRASVFLADESGLGIDSKAYQELEQRWRRYGFLTSAWIEEYEATGLRATEFAALVMSMDAVQWVVYTCGDPVDLDAEMDDYELVAGESTV